MEAFLAVDFLRIGFNALYIRLIAGYPVFAGNYSIFSVVIDHNE